MHRNSASDGKSSRISTENALRCSEMIYLTENALKYGTNAREDTRRPFLPFKYDVDFSSTNYHNYFTEQLPTKNIVDILDPLISTNYGLLLFAKLMPFVVDINDFSNIFGKNYKYNLSIVVNCPKQRNTGKEKSEKHEDTSFV